MAVTPFEEGDLFVYRIIKHHNLNPDRQWSNTYEFAGTAPGSESAHLALVDAIVAFEAELSLETTVFDRATVSTWAPDSKPYDPLAFISVGLTSVGGITPPTDAAALTTAMSVTRAALTGRSGHLFYRNMLVEGDISAPAGKQILVDRTAKQGNLATALTTSGLEDYIGASPTGAFAMVMVGETDAQVRRVVGLVVSGVTTLPVDHMWFNRTTPAP